MIGTIELIGMEFHAYHGCLEEERRDGNLFVADFRCEYEIGKAAESDILEDTLNYAEIYDIIAAEMAVPSNLLEHVTARIVKAIAAKHPEIPSFSVSIAKQNPPVAGKAEWSKVTINWPVI